MKRLPLLSNNRIWSLLRILFALTVAFVFMRMWLLPSDYFVGDDDEEEASDFADLDELLANKSDWGSYQSKLIVHKTPIGVPFVYDSLVDFRIIVMTYSRATSLAILLESLEGLKLDNSTASVEIWIDRNAQNKISEGVLEAAMNFTWTQGRTTVHIHSRHVGIYGQWIDTWSPNPFDESNRELALFLEDDMSLSVYAYRWIRSVHDRYGGRADFAGASLNGGGQMYAHNSGERIPASAPAFMYICVGTWGFSPSPRAWLDFQDWFHANTSNLSPEDADFGSDDVFNPIVEDSKPSEWYASFRKTGRANTMWEMWLIFYTVRHALMTVYSNLDGCLGLNRQEVGLHRSKFEPKVESCPLLSRWSPEFVDFPDEPEKFDWWGKILN